MKARDLFSLPPSLVEFAEHFGSEMSVWEWVTQIKGALEDFDFETHPLEIDKPAGLVIEGDVFIHSNVVLPAYGYIKGPVYIGAHCELRPGVYIRGNVIVGERCVLGNSCEYKNCLLMDNVATPHFNYVGDSVLGTNAHLAAGAITANVRLDRGPVKVDVGDDVVVTGLKKLGAMIGEGVEVGCNAVLQPGVVLERGAVVGPTVACGGRVEAGQRVMRS